MCDGYDPSLKDEHPNLEDELLCEYVDGTMDPVVREVFEEYLRENPDVRSHVECLRNTRLLLCHYGCRCHAPRDLHDRLRRQITCDLLNGKVPFHILVADRLKGATISSAMVLLLMVGIAGGFSIMQDADIGSAIVSAAVITSATEPIFTRERPAVPLTLTPRYLPRMSTRSSVPRTSTLLSTSERVVQGTDTSVALLVERSGLLP